MARRLGLGAQSPWKEKFESEKENGKRARHSPHLSFVLSKVRQLDFPQLSSGLLRRTGGRLWRQRRINGLKDYMNLFSFPTRIQISLCQNLIHPLSSESKLRIEEP